MGVERRICDMLLEWEEARAAGKPVSAEELCAAEPELAAPLKYRIAKLEAMNHWLQGPSGPASEATLIELGSADFVPARLPAWHPPGYQILGELGRGGMGVVYKARQIGLDRVVALKTIPASALPGSSALARFDIEARAVARLRHPNIVQIYEVGSHAGCPYFSLEYMDGGSLARFLGNNPIPIPIPRAARIAELLARAIHYAHTRGIVHRDLKPSNVLMSQGENGPDPETVKIGDFGLARLLVEGTSSHLTRTGTTMGTPSYMAPEQAQGKGKTSGPATDVYGLGAILYEMLSGQPPFRADTDWMTIHQVVTGALEPIQTTRPECPPALEAICLRCLAKDPAERYASAEALANDLRRFLDGRPVLTPVEARYSRRAWLAVTAACAVGSLGATAAVRMARYLAPIKVGIVQSQTEFMGDTGQAVINATLFAIDEINRAGGVLGRQIHPVVGDGQSDELVFAREARRLLDDESVSVLFACLTSTHRRTVEPVVREYNRLLVYPGESEGLEVSPHVICLGPLPNQHILPGVDWFRKTLGKRRFYFVGSDTVYVRAVRAILGDFAPSLAVDIVGESYVDPTDVVGWSIRTVDQIESVAPDAIVTLLQGKANLPFIHRLRTRRITPEQIPTLSCTFTEHDLRNILGQMAGDYLCGHYYRCLDTRENARFLARMADDPRLSDTSFVSDAMVAAYMGVRLWVAAVARAGTFLDLAAVRQAMVASSLPGPGGPVQIDPTALCDSKYSRVAQVGQDRGIAILWSSPVPWAPVAYPATRTRAQWDALIQGLHARWGGHWSNREYLRTSGMDSLPR
jgi:urea transport system substrate-binding protein